MCRPIAKNGSGVENSTSRNEHLKNCVTSENRARNQTWPRNLPDVTRHVAKRKHNRWMDSKSFVASSWLYGYSLNIAPARHELLESTQFFKRSFQVIESFTRLKFGTQLMLTLIVRSRNNKVYVSYGNYMSTGKRFNLNCLYILLLHTHTGNSNTKRNITTVWKHNTDHLYAGKE